MRNDRGQVQQAATQRAAAAAVAASQAPQQPAVRAGAEGAFGQRPEGDGPQNRAERRAQERKGR